MAKAKVKQTGYREPLGGFYRPECIEDNHDNCPDAAYGDNADCACACHHD